MMNGFIAIMSTEFISLYDHVINGLRNTIISKVFMSLYDHVMNGFKRNHFNSTYESVRFNDKWI